MDKDRQKYYYPRLPELKIHTLVKQTVQTVIDRATLAIATTAVKGTMMEGGIRLAKKPDQKR